MAISPEIKKYGVIGGALIVSVVGGIWAYKHFENSSAASNAAANQSNQDTLAYEMEQLAAGSGYGSFSGSSFAPQTSFGSETSQPQTLVQEIAALEGIFNPSAPASGPAASPAPATGPVASSPVTTSPKPIVNPIATSPMPVEPLIKRIPETPMLEHEGVSVA